MQNKTTMFLINTYKQRHSVCTTKNNRRHEYEQLNTKIQSLKRAYAQEFYNFRNSRSNRNVCFKLQYINYGLPFVKIIIQRQ